jgi:hypothetical protein
MIEEPKSLLQPTFYPFATPRVSMMQERLIGRVVVVWAKLEGILNDLIWAIQGKEMADGRSETERMQITPLIGTIRNLVKDVLVPKGMLDESIQTTALLDEIDNIKNQRNLIVHGMWGEIHGIAAVGSLRIKTADPNNVIYEDWPSTRMVAFADQTARCRDDALKLVERIETLRGKPLWRSPLG